MFPQIFLNFFFNENKYKKGKSECKITIELLIRNDGDAIE